MKKFLFVLTLAFAVPATVLTTGCPTTATTKSTEVTTLKIVGGTAKAALDSSAVLLKEGRITVAQWQRIADAYDHTFQPTFNLAVAAVNSDLSTVASPDIIALAAKFAAVVAEVTSQAKP